MSNTQLTVSQHKTQKTIAGIVKALIKIERTLQREIEASENASHCDQNLIDDMAWSFSKINDAREALEIRQ